MGGFHQPLMTNEDMLIAADFLDAGYKLAYCASAKVWHSHDYKFKQEFERNRNIGRFMFEYGERFGSEMGEGINIFRAVTGQLIQAGYGKDVIPFWINCSARILGNWVGKHDH